MVMAGQLWINMLVGRVMGYEVQRNEAVDNVPGAK